MSELLRMEYLIKKEGISKLKNAKVMVCGVGGVGSFVAEALARSGIGKLVLVDYDIIEISNLNRQLETKKDNIGLSKVFEMKKRIEEVSFCQVECLQCFIDEDFEIDDTYDYVVDCIDTLKSKFILAKKCHQANVKHISSLGAARRLDPTNIIYTTLKKTKNDPLAKNFRCLCRKEKYYNNIEVVCCDSPALKQEVVVMEETKRKKRYPLGSSMMVVGSVGLKIAAVVINKILEVGR